MLGGSSIKDFLVAVEKKAHFNNILVFMERRMKIVLGL